MYTIETDRVAARIEVTMNGFLSAADVTAFTHDIAEAVRQVRLAGKQQTIFYDYTCAAIQSQEVIAALQELAASNRLHSKRVALYTGGRLARMQAKRIAAGQDHFAVFDDRDEALAWLDAA